MSPLMSNYAPLVIFHYNCDIGYDEIKCHLYTNPMA